MPKNFNTPDQNNNLKNNLGGKFGKSFLQIALATSVLVSACVKETPQPNTETIPNTINLNGTLPDVITLKGGDSTVIDLSATDLLGETLTPKISTSGNIVATVANGKLTIKSTDYNDSKGEVTIDCNSSEERNVREEDKNKDFNGDGDKDDIFNFSAENLRKVIAINIQANPEAQTKAEIRNAIAVAKAEENGTLAPNTDVILKEVIDLNLPEGVTKNPDRSSLYRYLLNGKDFIKGPQTYYIAWTIDNYLLKKTTSISMDSTEEFAKGQGYLILLEVIKILSKVGPNWTETDLENAIYQAGKKFNKI